jgi:dipeptide/tripeptide permease
MEIEYILIYFLKFQTHSCVPLFFLVFSQTLKLINIVILNGHIFILNSYLLELTFCKHEKILILLIFLSLSLHVFWFFTHQGGTIQVWF